MSPQSNNRNPTRTGIQFSYCLNEEHVEGNGKAIVEIAGFSFLLDLLRFCDLSFQSIRCRIFGLLWEQPTETHVTKV